MKKFALILSGCGVYDGTEIHETTMTMLAIKKFGADYQIFAPDIDQFHVINHVTGKEMNEKRNVLVESARIARGKIKPLEDYNPLDFDALIIPGGFGAAKNLSTYAIEGTQMKVNELLAEKILNTITANKAIGALCIAPVIIAKVVKGAEITIGSDKETISAIEKIGGKHTTAEKGNVIFDKKTKIFTTPCYMLDGNIYEVALSCENIVKAMLEVI
ncbi:MAG: isoprenoid biosynthesis glyoxalase ElbB [Bacteroidales bacterium]|nr:isoprenoid biosynthesis glyoxalase ElbB [Bacteroidales bacterium]